jgi:hypothetical protein
MPGQIDFRPGAVRRAGRRGIAHTNMLAVRRRLV